MYTKPMYLDRKLIQDIAVHHNATENPDMFGVEVELEGRNIKTITDEILKHWTLHNDGSLRTNLPGSQAVEYVFNSPLDLKNTEFALKNLFNYLNRPDVEVFRSYRTSIHVHLSCALETMRTIFNFMTLSVIFDELLTSQNGEHRIGNNFCLRAKDAQGQLTEIVQSIEQFGNFFHVSAHNRYSSINFVSLTKFGTIEFRSLECTTDLSRVIHWVHTLDRLRKAARGFDDPRAIIQRFNEMSANDFLYFILGPQAAKYEMVEGWERMLHSGMRLAQDLAYSSKWIRADKKENDPKKVVPKKAKPLKLNVIPPTPNSHSAAQLYSYIQAQQMALQAAQAQPIGSWSWDYAPPIAADGNNFDIESGF